MTLVSIGPKTLFKLIAGLLGLLVVLVLALTFIGIKVDLSYLRGGVEASAKMGLGREVTIAGPVELEFSYWPALEVSDVKIANEPGASQPIFFHAGLARLKIGIIPLLMGKIEIADITAHQVTLNLETDTQGEPNWVFGKQDKAKDRQPVPGAEEPLQGNSPGITFAGFDRLSLKQITVNYKDRALGKSLAFKLDSMLGTAAEGEPMMLDFEGHVQDKGYDLELHGGSIDKLLEGGEPWAFELKGAVISKQIAAKGDMTLRDHDPVINLAFGIRDVDVGAILSKLGLVEGMQASMGDVAFKATVKGDSLTEIMQQSSMTFTLKEGSWHVVVPNTDTSFDIDDMSGDILVERGNAITMRLAGSIDEIPVELFITGAPLVEYIKDQKELPLNIDAKLARSRLGFSSTVQLPITSRDMTFALKFSSERIDHLNRLVRLDLPPVGPVSLDTKLDVTPQGYHLSKLDMAVGSSRLNGSLELITSQRKPKLDISLVSELVQFDDFDTGKAKTPVHRPADDSEIEQPEQTTGEQAVEDLKKLLSYEVLNALDADIHIEAQELKSGNDLLGAAQLNIGLREARLSVEPLVINIPGGGIEVNLDYTPSTTDVEFNIQADIEEFDLGIMARRARPGTDMGGKFTLDAKLQSKAHDLSSVMEHANGHLDFALVPENFSAGVIDLWAVNLLSAIMDKSTEKDQSDINCVVVRFGIEEGVMEERAIYLDTTNMRIAGKSDINFKTRDLDIKLVPKAKNPEFFSVAVPIKVKGRFDDFGIKIGVLRMTGQILSFITSPIHVPIRRIFTDEEPTDGVEACKAAWVKTKNAGSDTTLPEQDGSAELINHDR